MPAAAGLTRQVNHLFDMTRAELSTIAAQTFIKTADQPFGERTQRSGFARLRLCSRDVRGVCERKGRQKLADGDYVRIACRSYISLKAILHERRPEYPLLAREPR